MAIVFSDSNQYVQDTQALQKALGFVNPLAIDIYVKRSFFLEEKSTTLSWGLIASFTKDHLVDEEFLYYQIQSPSLSSLPSTQTITCTLEGKSSFVLNLLQWLLQWTPIIALLIISIAMLFLPPALANIFRRISVIGIIITYSFYIYKIARLLYKAIITTGIDYNGLNVVYAQEQDIAIFPQDIFPALKDLATQIWAAKIVVYQWNLHIKQSIRTPSLWQSILLFFFPHEETPDSYDQHIDQTTQKIFSASFIWLPPTPHA